MTKAHSLLYPKKLNLQPTNFTSKTTLLGKFLVVNMLFLLTIKKNTSILTVFFHLFIYSISIKVRAIK